jgi:hypothetical protein
MLGLWYGFVVEEAKKDLEQKDLFARSDIILNVVNALSRAINAKHSGSIVGIDDIIQSTPEYLLNVVDKLSDDSSMRDFLDAYNIIWGIYTETIRNAEALNV